MLFYAPLRAEPKAVRVRREARALAVCAQCVVRDECLQHAVDNNERYGIWGGLTDRERRLALVESAPGQPGATDADVAAPPGHAPAVEF